MVRTPCCEKMGTKKGPWTPEEDEILVSHIHRYGHDNWRALPKQAGTVIYVSNYVSMIFEYFYININIWHKKLAYQSVNHSLVITDCDKVLLTNT